MAIVSAGDRIRVTNEYATDFGATGTVLENLGPAESPIEQALLASNGLPEDSERLWVRLDGDPARTAIAATEVEVIQRASEVAPASA